EAIRLPRPNRALVGADDEIELHGAEAAVSRARKRMFEHRTREAAPLRGLCGHVTAVRDVAAATRLVRAQEVGPQNHASVFGDEDLVIAARPVLERALARDVTRKCVGLPCAQHGLENRPDRSVIALLRGSDQHARRLCERLYDASRRGSGEPDWEPSAAQ